MACEECKRLDDEVNSAWRSFQGQQSMNQQMSNRGKEARRVEERLQQAHSLACAEVRLHKGRCHPEGGYKVDIGDINIKIRDGRTSP
jgi:hypothetical protein